tara:strand:- start:78 stop:317 length:240 start_codon:yes stop_codon:yes gene_type:complete
MEEQTKKIKDYIIKIEELTIKEAPKVDDQLLFCAAMVSMVRTIYLNTLGVEQTNIIFEQLAASFQIVDEFYMHDRPTIH